MYILKQIPEDFIVREISTITFKEEGKYLYFRLTKTNWNTLDAIKKISFALHVPLKNFGYAGTKDRHAVTEQVCSVYGVKKERLDSIAFDRIKITVLGYGNEPLSLGDLVGNKFEITVRNFTNKRVAKKAHFVNYFDEQRFSRNNVAIGRAIVKKDFKKAAKLIDSGSVIDHLQEVSTDFVGALRTLPKKLLLLFVHAYQSYLWNETVARYFESKEKEVSRVSYSAGEFVFVSDLSQYLNLEIPLVGFFTDLKKVDVRVREIVETLLDEEDLEQEDFIIKQIPGLSCEGAQRKVVQEIKDLTVSNLEDDELNEEKKKLILTFTLTKGNYATMVVKQLLS